MNINNKFCRNQTNQLLPITKKPKHEQHADHYVYQPNPWPDWPATGGEDENPASSNAQIISATFIQTLGGRVWEQTVYGDRQGQ
jgi:hypothetical protein